MSIISPDGSRLAAPHATSRPFSPRLDSDPSDPSDDDATPVPVPLIERLESAAEQFGRSPAPRRPGSRSRADGYRPNARRQVEDYLTHQVLGVSLAAMARATGRPKSTVASSVWAGRQLVHEGAKERGFLDPERGRLERDADDERGFCSADGIDDV